MASIKRRRSSEIWTAFFRDHDGRQHCRSTETTDRKLAQTIADQFEAGAQKKRTLRQLQRVLAQMHELVSGEGVSLRVSLRTFASEWLEAKKLLCSPLTATFYSASAHKLISFLGARADAPMREITKRDLLAYRAELCKTLAPQSTNHHLTLTKMLFRGARRDEIIDDDPAQFVETLRRSHSQSNRRAFTIPELGAVLSVSDPEWYSMVLFGLYTGQRLGDLATLTWNNIDLARGELRFITAKTGRSMILPMAPALARHVLGACPPSDNPEAPLHPRAYAILTTQGRSGTLSNQFSDLLAQAGLREKKTHQKTKDGRASRRTSESLGFHNLRHTATSWLHEAGVPAATCKEFIGHNSEAVHALYTHVGTESLQKAANALPELL